MNGPRRPRVAILTTLTDYAPAYSLVGIILNQARALHRAGYEYDVLCLKNFKQADRDRVAREGLNVRYVLPQTVLHPYRPNEPPRPTSGDEIGFEDQVSILLGGAGDESTGYMEALKPYDVVIDHDIMFLEHFLPMNQALRRVMEKYPEKQYLHWVHSGPSGAPADVVYPSTLRFQASSHGRYVYLNETDRLNCALMMQTDRSQVSVVYNPVDIRDLFGFSQETCELIDRYGLLDHEILQVYPFSSPRWISKGVRQLIRLFGHWKASGVKAKLVLVNAHANSKSDEFQVRALEAYAARWGLDPGVDVILTSRFAEERAKHEMDLDRQATWKHWRHSVPMRIVTELSQCSNMFVFPSESECCSLIQAQAAVIGGQFIVLNKDFVPMLEFADYQVLHYHFSRMNPDDNVSAFYSDVAREILTEFRKDPTITNTRKARTKTYNRDWVFKRQLEPLLYEKLKAGAQSDDADLPPVKTPTHTVTPPRVELHPEDGTPQKLLTEAVNYSDPQPGDPCPIFERCSIEQKKSCYDEAGHCLLLDEEP